MANYEPFYKCINVVIDIETLGVNIVTGSPVTQIAAAYFDRNNEIVTMSVNVDSEECIGLGLTVSESTMIWFEGVDPAITNAWFIDPISIEDALTQLDAFIDGAREEANANASQLLVFGNSPRFDFNMIDHLYRVVGRERNCWTFREEGCYRTLIRTFPPSQEEYTEAEAIATELFPDDGLHSARWDAVSELIVLESLGAKLQQQ